MGRWVLAALGLLVGACGSTGGGPPPGRPDAPSGPGGDAGPAREDGGSAGDGGVSDAGDAGSPADSGSDAGPGTGSACSAKPLLDAGLRIAIDTTAVGETGVEVGDQVCLGVRPADGEGYVVAHWSARINGSPQLFFDSAYLASGGPPLATTPPGGTTIDRTQFFPLAQGWIVVPKTGGQGPFGYVVTRLTSNFETWPGGPALSGPPTYGFVPAPGGGVVAYRGLFGEGPPCSQLGIYYRVLLTRWNSQGARGPEADLGCYPEGTDGTVATNARGDVVAIYGGQWWHLAPDGTLTHHPFDRPGALVPLIDGRFALNDGSWSTVDAEGAISPGPSWLTSRTDIFHVDIVLGGTAYLLHHETEDCSKSLELVLEDGTGCGFIPIPGPDHCGTSTRVSRVAVGLDGTISAVGTGSCTMFVWKGALGRAPTP